MILHLLSILIVCRGVSSSATLPTVQYSTVGRAAYELTTTSYIYRYINYMYLMVRHCLIHTCTSSACVPLHSTHKQSSNKLTHFTLTKAYISEKFLVQTINLTVPAQLSVDSQDS